jgi:hypothetical protein
MASAKREAISISLFGRLLRRAVALLAMTMQKIPLTPTLSPQAGRGGDGPPLRSAL